MLGSQEMWNKNVIFIRRVREGYGFHFADQYIYYMHIYIIYTDIFQDTVHSRGLVAQEAGSFCHHRVLDHSSNVHTNKAREKIA
jgi:hypothetical protein